MLKPFYITFIFKIWLYTSIASGFEWKNRFGTLFTTMVGCKSAQARRWASGRGDVSSPSFGSHSNPISTRGGGGRLCPPYTGVYTKFWKPQACLQHLAIFKVGSGNFENSAFNAHWKNQNQRVFSNDLTFLSPMNTKHAGPLYYEEEGLYFWCPQDSKKDDSKKNSLSRACLRNLKQWGANL